MSDISKHTGTTLTLAHTSKAVKASSTAYEKASGIESKPLEKGSGLEDFAASLHNKIVLLQLISLQSALQNYLQSKPLEKLTEKEKQHLQDMAAPNYLETSLLPALAILRLTERESTEFSSETASFLNSRIAEMNHKSFGKLIETNQRLLEKGAFSAKFSSWEEMEQNL